MQKYRDEADNLEYIYTMSEPYSAHRWFPCFDQPDLKAPYELLVLSSTHWRVVATAAGDKVEKTDQLYQDFGVSEQMLSSFDDHAWDSYQFAKSVKISTYLYCVCAGPYEEFTPEGSAIDEKIPMKLYCRPSLKKYVAEIAQDWFRVTKHGIHFYEKIFSAPYPFDKFD